MFQPASSAGRGEQQVNAAQPGHLETTHLKQDRMHVLLENHRVPGNHRLQG
jgi:hypothetical protein